MQASIAISTIVLLSLVFSACSNSNEPQFPTVTLTTAQIEKYDASCKVCHESSVTGSPQRGNQEHWRKVLSNPVDTVMQRVINGYKGMPPLGQCFDCSAEDLKLLVQYLAQPINK